jgi:thiamine biosynthesis lipoprotein
MPLLSQRRDGATASRRLAAHGTRLRATGALALGAVAVAAAASLGATAALATAGWNAPPARVERQLMLMGTWLDVAVSAPDEATASAAAEAAVRALESTEARLSTWRADTELARLNAAAVGKPVPLSPALAAELTAARSCGELTRGAFDPAVGRLTQLWDLRGAGRIPADDEVATALPGSRSSALQLDGATATRLHPALLLDEGGFGKGSGLDHAIAAAGNAGATAAWLDLGGQTAQLGDRQWPVAVAHPDDRDLPAVELTLAGGSLATSGNGVRAVGTPAASIGHILDPRTGAPAADFGSLTVWAERALLADCLSTGLFVLGPDAALAWAAAHPEVGVLALERRPGGGLRARASGRFAGRVRTLDTAVELSFELSETAAPAAAFPEKERSSGPSR